jgi:hypothetical protein
MRAGFSPMMEPGELLDGVAVPPSPMPVMPASVSTVTTSWRTRWLKMGRASSEGIVAR